MIDGILPPGSTAGSAPRKKPKPIQKASEPAFRPPEAVAAEDDFAPGERQFEPPRMQPSKRRWKLKVTKKQAVLIGAVFLLLGGGGVAAFIVTREKKPVVQANTPPPVVKKEEPPKPTTIASPLTGLQVAPELAAVPVIGAMIENSPEARPQSGLKEAGVVFEAVAEGGITRFMALYQETQPDYIGPVRSVRPYYLEWLQGYDAAIAHVGGSPEALALIKSAGIRDLDQFFNTGPYQRVRTRFAPHNMYASVPKLSELARAKGYTTSSFTGFVRKAEKPAPPTVRAVDLGLSGYLYNVRYDYDAASNSYLRSQGGKPHVDERSGSQLAPKVVVALVVPFGIKPDGLHSDYRTTGNGKAYIFQDGGMTEGVWEKADSKSPLRLGDANGSPLAINPGQTWVTAVTAANKVTPKP